MKTNWNEQDFKVAEREIRKFLKSRRFDASKKNDVFRFSTTFKQLDDICSFVYTSSGEYAGYFIANITLFLDDEQRFEIQGFCMNDGGFMFIHCWDVEDNNNELYIRIQKQ